MCGRWPHVLGWRDNLGKIVSLFELARGRPACVLASESVCKFMELREAYPERVRATLVGKLLLPSRG